MCKPKIALLTHEEKEEIDGKKYAKGKRFTPIQDANDNWVLPLDQIKENENIDYFWVKYLPIIEYNKKDMDKSIIPDVAALSGLFLFTGAEVSIEGTIFEIISKFGVVAVLWFWLREMKTQIKDQLTTFSNETELLRQEHKNTLNEFQEVHKEHKALLTEQLKAKDEIIKKYAEEKK